MGNFQIGVLLITGSFLTAIEYANDGDDIPRALAMAAYWVCMVGVVVFIVWYSLATPYFESGDARAKWMHHPGEVASGYRLRMFMIPAMMIIVAAMVIPGLFIDSDRDTKVMQSLLLSGAILLAACMVALAIWPLHRACQRRLRRNISIRQICFHCGYDLHASPGTHCPECGAAIPWLNGVAATDNDA
ncbi:MAG: hypothetical protein GVY24_00960 [Planctomycetes bacterium]|nr:hypothetical protein [Planctomycetota bacterium]